MKLRGMTVCESPNGAEADRFAKAGRVSGCTAVRAALRGHAAGMST